MSTVYEQNWAAEVLNVVGLAFVKYKAYDEKNTQVWLCVKQSISVRMVKFSAFKLNIASAKIKAIMLFTFGGFRLYMGQQAENKCNVFQNSYFLTRGATGPQKHFGSRTRLRVLT